MRLFKAASYPFLVQCVVNEKDIPYPILRDDKGCINIYCISPVHGRSFVLGKKKDGRWVVGKGNGLSYSSHSFLNTGISDSYLWGFLPKMNAIRDFEIGIEVSSLGIKTNQMEYVLEIDKPMKNGAITPFLLQYNVECPYRICDYAFMSKSVIGGYLSKWDLMNNHDFIDYHLIAADVLIKNLRIMHDNNIMHNAIHIQNYTWALELVDFEGARTNRNPYSCQEYESHVPNLIQGEIIQTYEIINYIAFCLKESVNFKIVDNLFCEYGYDLKKLTI